jgi:hypothetical protein
MAEFIYSTRFESAGPWFIDAERLEALDRVLEDYSHKIDSAIESDVLSEIEKETSELEASWERSGLKVPDERRELIEGTVRSRWRFRKTERSVWLFFGGTEKLKVQTFKEASLQPQVLKESPVGFSVLLRSEPVECDISGNARRLEVTTSPENLSQSRDLFVAIRNVVAPLEPSWWLQAWRALGWTPWFVWLVWLVAWNPLWSGDPYRSQLKKEAHELLQGGISPEKQKRAIEILLSLASDYRPPGTGVPVSRWYWILLFGGFVACLALSFQPPGLLLGIGRGAVKIRRWGQWVKFVSRTAPIYLLLNLLLPFLQDLAKKLLWP